MRRWVRVYSCVCMLPLSAVRCVDLTVDATESGWAAAGIAVHAVGAVPPVAAGGAHALIDVLGATLAAESSYTHTCEAVHTVHTHTTIAAGI